MQLRLLQVLEQQPGHTVVLGVPGGVIPVPRGSSPEVVEGDFGPSE
jgi:hypothetical protein